MHDYNRGAGVHSTPGYRGRGDHSTPIQYYKGRGVHSTPGYGGKGVHSTPAIFPFIPSKAPTCKTGNSKVY